MIEAAAAEWAVKHAIEAIEAGQTAAEILRELDDGLSDDIEFKFPENAPRPILTFAERAGLNTLIAEAEDLLRHGLRAEACARLALFARPKWRSLEDCANRYHIHMYLQRATGPAQELLL